MASDTDKRYTRADVQRIANKAAQLGAGTMLFTVRELLEREAKASRKTNFVLSRRLEHIRALIDNLPAIDGVTLNGWED